MSQELYEILSLGARYWFMFLGLLIVWRSFSWLRKDRRAKHRRLRQLPDAGMIGEMVVLQGSDELPEGTTLPVPREGTLGFIRSCDVVVPCEGVAARHCDFVFQDGLGLKILPRAHCTVTVDDEPVTQRTRAADYPMHHGSRLEVGSALLRLRLFAGLKTKRHADVMPDAPTADDLQNDAHVYHQIPAEWCDTGRYAPMMPPETMGYPPVYDPNQTQGYPPVYDPNQMQGYPPVYDPNQTQGYPPVYDPNQMQGYPPVYDPNQTQGYPPVYDPNQAQCYPPVYDPNQMQCYPPVYAQNQTQDVTDTDTADEFARAVPRQRRKLFGRRRKDET